MRNRFDALRVDDGDEEEIREADAGESQSKGKSKIKIVGDSLCKHLHKTMKRRVENYSFLGAGIKRVFQTIEKISDEDSVVCIVAGGNDVQKRRSEELISQYKEALERVRSHGGTAIACGIFPRMGYGSEWMSRAIRFNCRMKKFCEENNIIFIDVWDKFYGVNNFYARDGVHLSRTGNSVLARLVDCAAMGFR